MGNKKNVSKNKILRAPISFIEWKKGLYQLPPPPDSSMWLVLPEYLLNEWCGKCHLKEFGIVAIHFQRDKDDSNLTGIVMSVQLAQGHLPLCQVKERG